MGLSAWLARGWNPLRGREKPQLGRGGAAAPPALPEDTPTAGPYPAKAFRSVIVLVVVLGGALLGLFAFKQTAQPPSRFAVFSVTMMLAAAAVAVGGLLGFLFGRVARGISAPGSHRSRRNRLQLPGSCHPDLQTAGAEAVHCQCANIRGNR